MFSSIRYKLLFFMTINIIIFALLLYGANTLFASKYYTENKKYILQESSKKIKDIIQNENINNGSYTDDVNFKINRLERKIGGVVVIGKLDGTIYYPSATDPKFPEKNEVTPPFRDNPFFKVDKNSIYNITLASKKRLPHKNAITEWEKLNDQSFFVKLQDPNLKIETLRFQTNLGNGLTLLIWVPIDQISESVKVSNTFTKIITLISITISMLLAAFLSKTFTKPITEINKTAKKISELDFSKTLKISGKDEISQLSQSINHLSYELSSKISELNVKNEQLKHDIEHERELDKLRKEFVSNVSHELKTPIFLIQGYAEGLKNNIANDEEKKNFYCDVIMEESDKMAVIVKDLLDISELENSNFSINKSNFNIVSLTKDIVNKMQAVLDDKSIDLSIVADNDFIVNADPVRIEQVIINLLNNAINHLNEKKKIRITLKKHDNKVKVLVYNTGEHIPDDSIKKIWDSFYKVDKARTREYGGSGLGLSIVQAIQKAHRNKYGVNNVKDGVEFWFDVDLCV